MEPPIKKPEIKNKLILILITILAVGNIIMYLNYRMEQSKVSNLQNTISDLKSNADTAPSNQVTFLDEANKPREYFPYEPPDFPGYMDSWKMLISEPNNFLFLYPERFYVESNKNIEYSPVVLKSNEDNGVIIAEKSKAIVLTKTEGTKEFLKFTQDISAGKTVEKYGSEWSEGILDWTSGGYLKEKDLTTNEVYDTFLGRQGPSYDDYIIRIRTQNLREGEFGRIGRYFKFLRSS